MWYILVILADVPARTMFIDIKTTQLTCTNPAETEQRRIGNAHYTVQSHMQSPAGVSHQEQIQLFQRCVREEKRY